MGTLNERPCARAMSAPRMVEQFLRSRGIQDPRILQAMANLPRHLFVPEALKERAYEDRPLPIGDDQTISQPYIVAYMTEVLELTERDRVLEIGCGSGYHTAVLASLARTVFSVERVHRLATEARQRLESLGLHNVSIRVGNGALGWAEYAPFERIVVTACATALPQVLAKQLAPNGQMVIPIGSGPEDQSLYLYIKSLGGLQRRHLCRCSFVPFIT